jgi:hypothetical protein
MIERRSYFRRRVYLGAKLSLGLHLPLLDCTVRDLSVTGARIVLVQELGLPTDFDIIFLRTGEIRRAFPVWRHLRMFGVAFRDSSLRLTLTTPTVTSIDPKLSILERRIQQVVRSHHAMGRQYVATPISEISRDDSPRR